jgi:uncharacterized protein YaaN involved in tellurite resistance
MMAEQQVDLANATPTPAGTSLIPALKFELRPEQQMDLSKLNSEQTTRVNQIVSSVSFSDTNSLVSFGADAQRELSQHLDALLEGIRTGETGRAGEVTIALATTIKELNLPKVKAEVESGGVADHLGRLPIVGGWFSALRALQQNHKKITDHLAAIEQKAQTQLETLRAMNDRLDRLVDSSIIHIKDLELYMAAGQILIKRARVEFEQRRAAAEASRDVIEITRLRDFAEQVNAFETRIVRIHLAHSRSITSVPEIRASQAAALIEMNNLMDGILFDLPELKRAILRVASLERTMQASKDTQARRDLTRELGSIAGDQLQDAYLKAKTSQGDFAADIAALSQSADKLLETIELGRRIDAANVAKREQAITDLSTVNSKFKDGLLEAGNRRVGKSTST